MQKRYSLVALTSEGVIINYMLALPVTGIGRKCKSDILQYHIYRDAEVQSFANANILSLENVLHGCHAPDHT